MEAVNEQAGIGESPAEQQAPVADMSTVARERMVEIIANNRKVISDCEAVLAILNEKPELDGSFCRLFGIRRASLEGIK